MALYGSRLRDQEIRILKLLPGDASSQLQCSLTRAWLEDSPAYDALSYVWGDPKDTRHVTIDGHTVAVTANLESALCRLRSTTLPLELWIDAVCINQKDVQERNVQVSMMGTIYSAARTVFIWIGAADELSDAAFDSMPAVAQGQVDDQARCDTCSFYVSLYQRPWFSRIWILQELALAREDPVVVCGKKQMLWKTFMSAWRVLAKQIFTEIGMTRQDEEDEEEVQILSKIKIDCLDELRSAVHREKGQSMRQLLIQARTSECTDPKDRIFGLLGMLRQEDHALHAAIDYRKSIATIYSEAVAHLFTKGQGPSFLSAMWLPGVRPRLRGLPSWSLDFSCQTGEKANGLSGNSFHPPHPWSASGVGAEAVNGTVLEDCLTLKVEALPVDVIEHVIYLPTNFRESLLQLYDISKFAETCRAKTIAHDAHALLLNAFKRSEPLWRILIFNKAYNSGYDVAPDNYQALFAELLTYCQSFKETIRQDTEIPLPDNDYVKTLNSYLPGRAFFSTVKGFVGLASPGILPGDEVTIWFGAVTPFVTRPEKGDESHCQLVSGAYVGGIMQGEMVNEMYCEDLLDSKSLLVR